MLMLTDRPEPDDACSQQLASDEAWPEWIRPHIAEVVQAIDDIEPGDVDITDDNDILQTVYLNMPEHVCDVLCAAPPAVFDAINQMVLHRVRS